MGLRSPRPGYEIDFGKMKIVNDKLSKNNRLVWWGCLMQTWASEVRGGLWDGFWKSDSGGWQATCSCFMAKLLDNNFGLKSPSQGYQIAFGKAKCVNKFLLVTATSVGNMTGKVQLCYGRAAWASKARVQVMRLPLERRQHNLSKARWSHQSLQDTWQAKCSCVMARLLGNNLGLQKPASGLWDGL